MRQIVVRRLLEEGCNAIRSLVNARGFQPACVWVLHGSFPVPVPMYGGESMILKKKKRSRVRAVQMDNLRGLLDIRRMNKVPNARIREFCSVMKGVDERMMKVFSSGLAMWKEWRMAILLRGSM